MGISYNWIYVGIGLIIVGTQLLTIGAMISGGWKPPEDQEKEIQDIQDA